MKSVFYEDVYGLEEAIWDILHEEGSVGVIADDAVIREIVAYFMYEWEYDVPLADIDKFGYDREYLLTIDAEEETLYVEKAYCAEHGIYLASSGTVFIQDTVNVKYIKDVKANTFSEGFKPIVFTFDEDDLDAVREDIGEDSEPQTCFEWDSDHCGFFYCECIGNSKQQFAYRGSVPLSDEAAQAIIKYRMS